MPRFPYSKPALSYSQQLEQLKRRGMLVEDESKAIHLLQQISYYRLSGYWYPLLKEPKKDHLFKPGSTFNIAFKLYCFDRELRLLIYGELEKIEVAVRAKMIYHLWMRKGAFWYLDPSLFKNEATFTRTLEKLKKEVERSDEEFIKAFTLKYSDELPPSCMSLEVCSFGNLSHIYKNLEPGRDKRKIAHEFALDDTTFQSWLHSFTYIRNVCAHHSRLWNKQLAISPRTPQSPRSTFLSNPPRADRNKSAYFLLSMILYLLNIINPNHRFKLKLNNLLAKYPMVDVHSMGFPVDWMSEEIWK